MIQIANAGMPLDTAALSSTERMILRELEQSPIVYYYVSPQALLFELKLRSNIVLSALKLYQSNAGFATFEKNRGNPGYWTLNEKGGLQQNPNVLASEAIQDIFINSSLYAFECATAMIVILYRAVLDTIGPNLFNAYFRNLLLYDWHYDDNLRLQTVYNSQQSIPGDIMYFKNPDHDPSTPEWQGENAILLEPGKYFGHGIGIETAEQMIAELNSRRIPYSTTSAYLTDEVVYPDFEYFRNMRQPIRAVIGSRSVIVV